jgi:hypothetical protein
VYPPFFELAVDGGRGTVAQATGMGSLKVRVKRLDGNFKAPLSLAVEGLPPGLAAEVKPVADGAAEYDVLFKGPAGAPEGTHSVRIVGVGTHNNQTKRVVLENVSLEIKK